MKFIPIKVIQAQERETTYPEHACATQPPWNMSKHCYEVCISRCQCGHIKIKPINVSQAPEVENTYLGRPNTMRSMWSPKEQIRMLNKLAIEIGMSG